MRALCILCVASLPLAATAKPVARDLDRVVTAYAPAFNGVVLVADHGKVVYERPVGLAVREWGVKHTIGTKFDIASMTKSFTAILILQLVEQGKVRVDAKLSEYIPEYTHAGEVTIHQLLTHTAGIPDYIDSLADNFMYCKPHKPLELVDLVAKQPLQFAPGSRFNYCNTCYILLGAVIEKVTGRPYAEAVQQRILTPAGMTESGMDELKRVLPSRAMGYIQEDENMTRAPLIDMSVAYATGGLYSTAHDLLKFDRALTGDLLLSAKSRALMVTSEPGRPYGYGWFVRQLRLPRGAQVTEVSHGGGGVPGFTTFLGRITSHDLTIIVLSNRWEDPLVAPVRRGLLRAALDETPSIVDALYPIILKRGAAASETTYRQLKQGSAYDGSEAEVNILGYSLLRSGRAADAVEVFRWNAAAYPSSANAYDSLGEAYLKLGKKDQAAESYRKSLELDPKNENARQALQKLQ